MNVIIYDLPERAEQAATEMFDDGAPLADVLTEAARIAVAEELRRIATDIHARADELDPDGAR